MRPIVLTILDGWGYSRQRIGNAIANAKTPNIDFIFKNYPSTLLQASGKAVGMTWGEAGNSEVGHLTIGAGRIIFQILSRINKSIETGDFFTNPSFTAAVEHCKKNNSKLHIAGLLTSGSVHSYFDHIVALIDLAKRQGVENTRLHLFMDGKDSGPREGKNLIKNLHSYLERFNSATIATLIGRDFAMDRNKNWDYTEKAYDLMVRGSGQSATEPMVALDGYYNLGLTDSKIPATVFDESGTIKSNDAIIFFNFREDSIRQLVMSFVENEFAFFDREKLDNVFVVGMVEYLANPKLISAFKNPEIKNCLAEVFSSAGKKQLHIAETEKYAHVTYFLNGLKDAPFTGEDDVIIQSLRTSIDNPEMKVAEIAQRVSQELKKSTYDLIVINVANADIMAHSGNYEVVVSAVEAVDKAVGVILNAVSAQNGVMIVTSDHGHAEGLIYKGGGEIKTAHELSPVPIYLVSKENQRQRSAYELEISLSEITGLLSDVAPTILDLMEIPQPAEMTGKSLVETLR